MVWTRGLAAAAVLAGLSVQAAEQELSARAVMKDASGKTVGEATFKQLKEGVLVDVSFTDLPEGTRAFHIHEVGRCEAPFDSAGKHFNPGKKSHGFANKGPHAGDLPNVHVPAGGKARVEQLISTVTLKKGKNSLLDADGSSLVIHAGPDDYKTDPAGNAGAHFACGVIEKVSSAEASPQLDGGTPAR